MLARGIFSKNRNNKTDLCFFNYLRFPFSFPFSTFFFCSVFLPLCLTLFTLFTFLFLKFMAASGLSLVAAGGGYSSLPCAGLSLRWPLLLRRTGSRCTDHTRHGLQVDSVAVAPRINCSSCSGACGIFLDQGSNPCCLH